MLDKKIAATCLSSRAKRRIFLGIITTTGKPGMDERDLVVYTPPESAQLAERFEVANPFEFLLIGKDGGVKLRKTEPVSLEVLFSTIDAMPMRQREMAP